MEVPPDPPFTPYRRGTGNYSVRFDRILVLDAGRAMEFGSPKELMKIEQGCFNKLVESSGEKDVVERMIFG